MDMIAYDHKDSWIMGLKDPASMLIPVHQYAVKLYDNPLNVRVEERGASDYIRFSEDWNTTGVGQPFALSSEDKRIPYPHYHKPSDTYDKIDFKFAVAQVKHVFVVMSLLLQNKEVITEISKLKELKFSKLEKEK